MRSLDWHPGESISIAPISRSGRATRRRRLGRCLAAAQRSRPRTLRGGLLPPTSRAARHPRSRSRRRFPLGCPFRAALARRTAGPCPRRSTGVRQSRVAVGSALLRHIQRGERAGQVNRTTVVPLHHNRRIHGRPRLRERPKRPILLTARVGNHPAQGAFVIHD